MLNRIKWYWKVEISIGRLRQGEKVIFEKEGNCRCQEKRVPGKENRQDKGWRHI